MSDDTVTIQVKPGSVVVPNGRPLTLWSCPVHGHMEHGPELHGVVRTCDRWDGPSETCGLALLGPYSGWVQP